MFSKSFAIFILGCSVFLAGCGEKQPESPEHTPNLSHASNETENHEHISMLKGQSIRLASFSDRLFTKNLRKDPMILGDTLVSYQITSIEFYDRHSLTWKAELKMDLDTAPVALDETHLLCVSDQKIKVVNIEDYSVQTIANLESSLFCKPLVIDDEKIFVQYVNNFSECFDLSGRSLWKVLLPIGSNYYKQTAYAPCYSGDAIYLAYPGSPLVKLDPETGRVLWLSKSLAEAKSFSPSSFVVNQLMFPLQVEGRTIYAQTILGDLVCIDTESGRFLGKYLVSAQSPCWIEDSIAYFVSAKGTLCATRTKDRTLLWETQLPLIEGVQSEIFMTSIQKQHQILVSMPHGLILSVNQNTGAILNEWVHHYGSCAFIQNPEYQNTFYGLSDRGSLIRFNESDFLSSDSKVYS